MIEITGPRAEPDECAWLTERLTRALALVAKPIGAVSIRIVDDEEMTRLHQRFMNDATTTDVLSWSETNDRGALEVELALCADEAERQARAHGHARRDELLLYAVHGVLHAAGFDDGTSDECERMRAEEARIIEGLGDSGRPGRSSHARDPEGSP